MLRGIDQPLRAAAQREAASIPPTLMYWAGSSTPSDYAQPQKSLMSDGNVNGTGKTPGVDGGGHLGYAAHPGLASGLLPAKPTTSSEAAPADTRS